MIEVLRCTVNNKPVEMGIDPRESLADVLRERLGLTSVKKGCEVGECGACPSGRPSPPSARPPWPT